MLKKVACASMLVFTATAQACNQETDTQTQDNNQQTQQTQQTIEQLQVQINQLQRLTQRLEQVAEASCPGVVFGDQGQEGLMPMDQDEDHSFAAPSNPIIDPIHSNITCGSHGSRGSRGSRGWGWSWGGYSPWWGGGYWGGGRHGGYGRGPRGHHRR